MFKFKLQAVLNKRINEEKIQYKKIAQYVQTHNRLNNELETIHKNIDFAKKATIIKDGDLMTGYEMNSRIIVQKQYITSLKSSIDVKQSEIDKNKKILSAEQKALVKAHQARKTIEILKEQAQTKYYERFEKAEKAALEETILIHYFTHNIKQS